jgi:Acetyltransferases, including N-acetylases of ribosomal proteins
MQLKSKNITLRPFMNSDKGYLLQWRADKNIRFMTMMHPYVVSENINNQWLEEVMKNVSNKDVYFAVEYNKIKTPIGYFTFQKIDLISRNAMLGIVIGNSCFRGKGFGKEIMETGMDYGFKILGLIKIFLDVLESNTSAVKLYKSLGFIEEGMFSNQFFFDGQWYNVIRMAKFSSEKQV